jgi:hypothetical protein
VKENVRLKDKQYRKEHNRADVFPELKNHTIDNSEVGQEIRQK